MPKLFVALSVRPDVAERLTSLQPQPQPGIRLVEPRQMHLTLHYIGEVDAAKAERLADALAMVAAQAFWLTIAGVGSFPPFKGATTLWAGMQESAELRSLHSAVARALVGKGFQPEARPYTPHDAGPLRGGCAGGGDERVSERPGRLVSGDTPGQLVRAVLHRLA